nr:restriction endonuclease subunit S [uncultured Schaedlerella sp.]
MTGCGLAVLRLGLGIITLISSKEINFVILAIYAILLNSIDLSGYITGSVQPKLSQSNLNAITLFLPEINVQRKIVEYLYMLDKKVTVNQLINRNESRYI